MLPFYATFGTGHAYSGMFVEIYAENEHAARAHMIKEHGTRWAELYSLKEFGDQAQRYGLRKMVTVQQRSGYPNQAVFFDVVRVAA